RQARAAMMDERVDQRARPVAGAGMHDEARRLAKDDQVVVLVEHVERDVFGLRLGIARLRQGDLDAVAGMDLALRLAYGRAVDAHGPFLDQRLDAAAREIAGKRG